MSKVCQVTGKRPMSGNTFPRQQQDPSAVPAESACFAAYGWRARNVGCVCVCPSVVCAPWNKKGIDVVLAEMARARREGLRN